MHDLHGANVIDLRSRRGLLPGGTHGAMPAALPAEAIAEPSVESPARSPAEPQATPPVLLPAWPGRRFVDLVAESVREVAIRDGHAIFQLMAHAVVQHLAAGARTRDRGESVDAALDGVLSLISQELQRQVSRPGALPNPLA
ncbi:hypothetical protein AB4Y64_15250 [Lysobacter sp. TAF61]|uniref:hypothetical protein n=1 Tax=Lysobacter sp. TAF61 TaxID=3233072 RepID=UPI003F965880